MSRHDGTALVLDSLSEGDEEAGRILEGFCPLDGAHLRRDSQRVMILSSNNYEQRETVVCVCPRCGMWFGAFTHEGKLHGVQITNRSCCLYGRPVPTSQPSSITKPQPQGDDCKNCGHRAGDHDTSTGVSTNRGAKGTEFCYSCDCSEYEPVVVKAGSE